VELKRKTMNKGENQSTIKSNAIRGPWSGYQIKRGGVGKKRMESMKALKSSHHFASKCQPKIMLMQETMRNTYFEKERFT
jgi:hypothetical protein